MKYIKIIIVFCIVLCMTCSYGRCETEDLEMKVFQLKYGNAESLYPVLDHLKSDKGKLSIHSGSDSLIAVDHPHILEKMGKVLGLLDIKPKVIEVKVIVLEIFDSFLQSAGLTSDRVIISNNEFNGLQYLLSTGRTHVMRSAMVVKALSGEKAVLQVSQEEFFPQSTFLHKEGTVVVPQTTRSAGNFLEVVPRVNNDGTVTVQISPSVSNFQDDGSIYDRVILTQVVVNSGDTIFLGGANVSRKSIKSDGLSFTGMAVSDSDAGGKKMAMFLTVTILEEKG